MNLLPPHFEPFAAVVSDFHWLTNAETACENFIMEHGMRRGFKDKAWRKYMRTDEAFTLGMSLQRHLRQFTDTVISLGDHLSHLVNVNGLAELRARLAALQTIERFKAHGWKKIIHVRSDHDAGIPHLGTDEQVGTELLRLYAEFEKTPAFERLIARAITEHPEHAALLQEPSLRDGRAFAQSRRMYVKLFGPIFGTETIGGREVLWCSDADLQAEKKAGKGEQLTLIPEMLAQKPAVKDRIFLIHSPQTLGTITDDPHCQHMYLHTTITGHLHTPWIARLPFVMPQKIRRQFNVKVCPSLTGNRIARGGGFLIGDVKGETRILRYSFKENKFWYV